MLNILINITVIALIVFLIISISKYADEKEAEKIAEKKRAAYEKEKERQQEEMRIENLYKTQLDAKKSIYGLCSADITIGDDPHVFENHLYVFENTSTVVLRGEKIEFSKILGYSLNDDSTQITQNHNGYESVTKTSTGNMLGRAVVGGVLLGTVGALAGATTAKKETTTTPTINSSTSVTLHHYIVYLNIDDLSNPTREIDLGSDTNKAHHIANLFNVIIQRNK